MRDRVQGTRYAHWSSFFLNSLIFIFSRYPHLPLVLSVPGPSQLDGCVKPVQHTTTTTTTVSGTHAGPISSACARYPCFGGNTPTPHSFSPSLAPITLMALYSSSHIQLPPPP